MNSFFFADGTSKELDQVSEEIANQNSKVLKAFGGSGEICVFKYSIFLDLLG